MFLLSVPASFASGNDTRKGVFLNDPHLEVSHVCLCVRDECVRLTAGYTPAGLSASLGFRGCRVPPGTMSKVLPYSCPTALSRKNHCFSKITFLPGGHVEVINDNNAAAERRERRRRDAGRGSDGGFRPAELVLV